MSSIKKGGIMRSCVQYVICRYDNDPKTLFWDFVNSCKDAYEYIDTTLNYVKLIDSNIYVKFVDADDFSYNFNLISKGTAFSEKDFRMMYNF